MKCNACHREASVSAKFSFSQAIRTNGSPRLTVSFETEGGYCRECSQRMERMCKENNFTEVIGADVREEVSIIFGLRGLGPVDWEGTVVEFFPMSRPDDNLSLPLETFTNGRS